MYRLSSYIYCSTADLVTLVLVKYISGFALTREVKHYQGRNIQLNSSEDSICLHCSDIDIKPVWVNKSSPSSDKFVRAEPPFSKNAISPVSDTSIFLLMFNEVNLAFPFPRSVQDKSLILHEETLRSFKFSHISPIIRSSPSSTNLHFEMFKDHFFAPQTNEIFHDSNRKVIRACLNIECF